MPFNTLNWPPSARLRRGVEFDQVFRTKNRFSGRLVRLFCVQTLRNEETRFGLAVGKKIAAAHERTRGRRIIREALRRLRPYVKSGVLAVVVMTPRGLNAKSNEVYDELIDLLAQARLLADIPPSFS